MAAHHSIVVSNDFFPTIQLWSCAFGLLDLRVLILDIWVLTTRWWLILKVTSRTLLSQKCLNSTNNTVRKQSIEWMWCWSLRR